MRKLNLCLHCGANEANRNDVYDVATPPNTDTWYPIPHEALIETVEERVKSRGMEIVAETHGLWADGNRYFGLLQVAGGDGASASDGMEDFSLVIGLRNSHDKKFPAAIACGSGVFVCDNLAFSGEIVVGRRHTKYINRDLPLILETAVGKLTQQRIDQQRRLELYKETPLEDRDAHDLIVRAMQAGALNTTRLPKVAEQWKNPAHDEFSEKNVWRLFNAFTEVYKGVGLTSLPNYSTRLHGLLDVACGLENADVREAMRSEFADNVDVVMN